eukprot:scaffold132178_cov19-Prasinocladus_malaysianus.AAC.1
MESDLQSFAMSFELSIFGICAAAGWLGGHKGLAKGLSLGTCDVTQVELENRMRFVPAAASSCQSTRSLRSNDSFYLEP